MTEQEVRERYAKAKESKHVPSAPTWDDVACLLAALDHACTMCARPPGVCVGGAVQP